MPRQKYQRPEVYATGKREKLWKGEWREYYLDTEGIERSRHKSKTWSRGSYTKTAAQAELDKLLREQQQGGPRRDGSMTLSAFWGEIYYPIRVREWAYNSRKTITSLWKAHIEPAFGKVCLKDLTPAAIQLHLGKLADSGKGRSIVRGVLVRLHSIAEQALDNDFIPKNPTRKIKVPSCKATPGVRSLTEDEVRQLWDESEGRDYVLWRLLLLTGARIGEVLALTRTDLNPSGLTINKSALNGKASTTKNKKERPVPIPASLRSELEEWLKTHQSSLMFPTQTGLMHRRNDKRMLGVLERARTKAIPDLTFRMCRTTFATLFDGDIRDAQEILGHHSADFTLKHYRKPLPARQLGAVEEMDRRLNVVAIRQGAA